jgi:hypothetical protein
MSDFGTWLVFMHAKKIIIIIIIIIGIFLSQKKETHKVKTILVDSTMELDWIRMVDQLPSTDPARVQALRKVRHIVNTANNFIEQNEHTEKVKITLKR